ncbi:hypothetical protein GCM10027432_01770 [Lysobacter fragariae]
MRGAFAQGTGGEECRQVHREHDAGDRQREQHDQARGIAPRGGLVFEEIHGVMGNPKQGTKNRKQGASIALPDLIGDPAEMARQPTVEPRTQPRRGSLFPIPA